MPLPPRDLGRWGLPRDFGKWGLPRDFGMWSLPRDFGRWGSDVDGRDGRTDGTWTDEDGRYGRDERTGRGRDGRTTDGTLIYMILFVKVHEICTNLPQSTLNVH